MQTTSGLTLAGTGLEGIAWDILGQTYKPVQWSEASFAFDTLFPPGTFVPEHRHPAQDEYIRVLEGELQVRLSGQELRAGSGDLVSLPRDVPHGITNASGAPVRALFWVAPAARLFELFSRIDGLKDPAEVVRLAGEHEVFFSPLPGA
jgi:mannose-6-phosphate isomerase-like protein (cupin superfamily)